MRVRVIWGIVLIATSALPLAAQRRTQDPRDDVRPRERNSEADERFTPTLRAGDRLALSNIDGAVTITQGGASAEIVAHKRVRRGDGSVVRAVMERTSSGYRICTVYRWPGDEDTGCNSSSRHDRSSHGSVDVEMEYEVRVPRGVELDVNTVDGNINASDVDTPGRFNTVDGKVQYHGVAPRSITSVDGSISAEFIDSDWRHDLTVRSVDGGVDVTLPADFQGRLSGSTVDGDVRSEFPVNVEGRFGPRTFEGEIGDGRGAHLTVSTVDGRIAIHRGGRSRR